jgi:hypothetical protein
MLIIRLALNLDDAKRIASAFDAQGLAIVAIFRPYPGEGGNDFEVWGQKVGAKTIDESAIDNMINTMTKKET